MFVPRCLTGSKGQLARRADGIYHRTESIHTQREIRYSGTGNILSDLSLLQKAVRSYTHTHTHTRAGIERICAILTVLYMHLVLNRVRLRLKREPRFFFKHYASGGVRECARPISAVIQSELKALTAERIGRTSTECL